MQEARAETGQYLPQRMVSWLWAAEAETAAAAGQENSSADEHWTALPGPCRRDQHETKSFPTSP